MSRRASVVAASSRRGSVMSTSFGAGQIDDDEITNQEIVEKLLSKEEQRKLERDRLIKQLENEDDSEQVDEEEEGKKSDSIQMRKCPYLDTINRAVLDFDFEKLCSVSLTHMNIYCCLTTGKYFQGRGKGTHAHTHALESGCRVFLNLHTAKFYCLPDNYEVYDPSLDDILYQLNPAFTHDEIVELSKPPNDDEKLVPKVAVDGSKYWTGFIGLNNIKHNDYINVVIQALAQIPQLKEFFLADSQLTRTSNKIMKQTKDRVMMQRFGELMRKIWKNHHYRPHVSPHEFLQSVVLASKGRFQFTKRGNAGEFLTWFLNMLDKTHKKQTKDPQSVIRACMEGEMVINSRRIPNPELSDEEKHRLMRQAKYKPDGLDEVQPFMFLTLDLPPKPLYVDPHKQISIPQVHMHGLLEKFNGVNEKEYKLKGEERRDPLIKKFRIKKLPDVLIFQISRFAKNNFFVEKNPTIVQYPVRNLDMGPYLVNDVAPGTEVYDLIANIVHDGDPKAGTYRVHCLHQETGTWKDLEDLVVSDALPEMIPLSEAFIQIWLRRPKPKAEDVPPPPPPPSGASGTMETDAAMLPPPPPKKVTKSSLGVPKPKEFVESKKPRLY